MLLMVHTGYLVPAFLLICKLFIFTVIGGVILCGVLIRIPILARPIGSHEASSLLKVGRLVQVLLAALNFGLHAPTRLRPLTQIRGCLLIATLICKLLILVVEPDLFKFLLLERGGRVVRKIGGFALKFVCCCVLDLLLVIREE